MSKIRKLKKFLTQPVKDLFSRRREVEDEDLYRAQATLQEKAAREFYTDARKADKIFQKAFQESLTATRKGDNASLQSIDNYVKAGNFYVAYLVISARLKDKEVKRDIERYRIYAERLIELLGQPGVGLYQRAAIAAYAMADHEEGLGKKEEKGCKNDTKQYGASAERFRKKGEEMEKKHKEAKQNKKALEDSVEEFTRLNFPDM
jgi:hypothetical protein